MLQTKGILLQEAIKQKWAKKPKKYMQYLSYIFIPPPIFCVWHILKDDKMYILDLEEKEFFKWSLIYKVAAISDSNVHFSVFAERQNNIVPLAYSPLGQHCDLSPPFCISYNYDSFSSFSCRRQVPLTPYVISILLKWDTLHTVWKTFHPLYFSKDIILNPQRC